MEINKRAHIKHDIALQNRPASNADKINIPPLAPLKNQLTDHSKKSPPTSALTELKYPEEAKQLEQLQVQQQLNAHSLSLSKTHPSSPTNTQNKEVGDSVIRHEQQIASRSIQAITSYHSVENIQSGQELLNRIELIV
ncbi:hypothetical protein JYT31_01685 [Beggiatoa alba]|nr:hypothetical protein [Beggiatoa alba]